MYTTNFLRIDPSKVLRINLRDFPAHGGTGFSSLFYKISGQQKKGLLISMKELLLSFNLTAALQDKLRDFPPIAEQGFSSLHLQNYPCHKKSPSFLKSLFTHVTGPSLRSGNKPPRLPDPNGGQASFVSPFTNYRQQKKLLISEELF